jgi:hypothetical protein
MARQPQHPPTPPLSHQSSPTPSPSINPSRTLSHIHTQITTISTTCYFPVISLFHGLVGRKPEHTFAGPQATPLNHLLMEVALVEQMRWEDFTARLLESGNQDLEAASDLLEDLEAESRRMLLVYEDMKAMRRECKRGRRSRKLVPTVGTKCAAEVLQMWWEMRKEDDMLPLEEIVTVVVKRMVKGEMGG